MSRPAKQGLDYFYIVCDPEDKIEYLEAKHGIIGFGVLIKLWRRIYKRHGYWCEWDERSEVMFAKKIGITHAELQEIVSTCFFEKIFSLEKYREYKILTSSGVQKHWLSVSKNAKRKFSEIDVKYSLLMNPPEETPVNSGGNHGLFRNTPEEMPQSKVKESKGDIDNTTYYHRSDERLPENSVGIKSGDELKTLVSKTSSSKKKRLRAKKESEWPQKLFNHIKSSWWMWFMERNKNQAPKFSGASAKAIDQIRAYLIAEGKKMNFAEESMIYDFGKKEWDKLLGDWERLKPNNFLYTSIDIKKINSNYNEIINFLNNGQQQRDTGRQRQTSSSVGKTIKFDKP